MRFGHFFYPMSLDPSGDAQAIDDALYEAELVEQLGFDAVWLAEHHFVGEVAYGDPLVFAGAVAMRTRRALIGLGVVEMALHNPVRLAIQTALLDNMSRGRLVVGTGRGSNYNSFEYAGFGTTVEEGHRRLQEAEELLVKAWTAQNVDHRGEFWQVRFPAIRPRPYQKPHPPIARACISDESVTAMARLGRPVLLRGREVDAVGRTIQLYRDAMSSSGFDGPSVEQALDQSWVWYEAYLAETSEQAFDEFMPAWEVAARYVLDMRARWNPPDQPVPEPPTRPVPRSAYGSAPNPGANEALVGSPDRVGEQLSLLRGAGVRNLMLTDRGLMTREQTARSLRLIAERLAPAFR